MIESTSLGATCASVWVMASSSPGMKLIIAVTKSSAGNRARKKQYASWAARPRQLSARTSLAVRLVSSPADRDFQRLVDHRARLDRPTPVPTVGVQAGASLAGNESADASCTR